MIRALHLLAGASLLLPVLVNAQPRPELQVVEPFVDLRTAPGRGYPVFDIAEHDETIVVIKERTGWIKVRNASGHEGWVPRKEMEQSLKAAGLLSRRGEVPPVDALPSGTAPAAAAAGNAF